MNTRDAAIIAYRVANAHTYPEQRKSDVLAAITCFQGVQAVNAPSSTEWQRASDALATLFAEMARRS